MASLAPALLALASFAVAAPAVAADDLGRWHAGAYSFSDELGGFRLLSASGTGTNADPVVLVAELPSASPVTLVVRAETPARPYASDGAFANGFVRVAIVVRNASGLAWTEFEFELQQTLGKPSDFHDGLSFDQRRLDGKRIASGGFRHFIRDYEPYDRLLFTQGQVDPGAGTDFSFLISDFTPREAFYLVMDPRIPSS